jgi:hypothetical protein
LPSLFMSTDKVSAHGLMFFFPALQNTLKNCLCLLAYPQINFCRSGVPGCKVLITDVSWHE